MRFTLTFLFLTLSVAPAFAGENEDYLQLSPGEVSVEQLPPGSTFAKLARVASDRDGTFYNLGLMRDAKGTPMGLALVQNGRPAGTATPYLFSSLAKQNGVSLFETQGRKVLLLQGVFNPKAGTSRFHLRYLTNGLFMSYASCDVLLANQGGKIWLENAYTKGAINTVTVVTSTFGVSTLDGVCPAQ